ncbi:aldehyde dehydrogenase (NADP(+)) [Pseudonocardiaceae bacterium YIM PH 21723]|nr:aldehyde dehydrogenase (NADP(+)) [Pseudonocardiaceae bacterium YIM PH 21723]
MTIVQGYDPRTGSPTGDPVPATSADEVDATVSAAVQAHPGWSGLPRERRAEILEDLAAALDGRVDDLVAVADAETALGETRLRGEVGRTTGQLRMFAGVLRHGGYVDAIISPADPAKARPDVRRMLQPLGPVAVFAASNFPFAFSVAGGDTASALAAGCPVVVKAHEAHPRTSALVAEVADAVLPAGVLSLVSGFDAGPILVRHPDIRAVGFTGSLAGGRALFDLANARTEPIPFFGELGSVNPVVVLPGAAGERPAELAEGYAGSLTLGAGQFCTNPGLLFVPEQEPLLAAIEDAVRAKAGGLMLSAKIRDGYVSHVDGLTAELGDGVTGSAADGAWAVAPHVWRIPAAALIERPKLTEEVFGPAGLIVTYRDLDELLAALRVVPGSLTGAVHASGAESADAATVLGALRAGRLIWNGWPTGVAVCWAMHHGGPYPATTAAAHTSVGATAIGRWLSPVAYQDWPDELLPPELRAANPLNIPRLTEA